MNVSTYNGRRTVLSSAVYDGRRVWRKLVYDVLDATPNTSDPGGVKHPPEEAPLFNIISEAYGLTADCDLATEAELDAMLQPVNA